MCVRSKKVLSLTTDRPPIVRKHIRLVKAASRIRRVGFVSWLPQEALVLAFTWLICAPNFASQLREKKTCALDNHTRARAFNMRVRANLNSALR